LHIKFVTNTSSESVGSMVARLKGLGFALTTSEIHSSLSATARYVRDHNLSPFCLLSPDAAQEIPNSSCNPDAIADRNAVVVGLAPDACDFRHLNAAFQILKFQNGRLIAINENKLVKRETDTIFGPGLVVKGLEYSSGCKAVLIGKPNAFMFESAIPVGVAAGECVMIGDVSGQLLVKFLGISNFSFF
jgi:ribonucleotide monophosphatase NagD (HAD superfamily)